MHELKKRRHKTQDTGQRTQFQVCASPCRSEAETPQSYRREAEKFSEGKFMRGFRPRKSVSVRKGLSIIEVALASSLLIVAMVPILKSLTKAQMFSSEIEYKTQALVLAQGKLDEIKAKAVYHYSSSFAAANTLLGNSYLCNVTDTGSGSDLRTVAVSVGFDKNGNSSLSSDEIEVTLTTYIANRWQ